MPGTRDGADPGSPDISVAVCGLGLMGLPIAFRLLSAGYRTIVWNRSQDRVRSAAERGAEVAPTPAEAAARADLVLTLLASPEALFEVVFGADGVARAAPKALAQAGTIACADMTALAARLPDGWDLLDTPVAGSVPQAAQGGLRLLVGADDEVFARWSPMLARLGEPVHVGPVPNGSALKQVLNAANAITSTINGDSLKKLLFAGLTYANIHTSNDPNGEIRGQIAPALLIEPNGSSTVYITANGFGG